MANLRRLGAKQSQSKETSGLLTNNACFTLIRVRLGKIPLLIVERLSRRVYLFVRRTAKEKWFSLVTSIRCRLVFAHLEKFFSKLFYVMLQFIH